MDTAEGTLHTIEELCDKCRIVGERIRSAREAVGFTRRELASYVGLSFPALLALETGRAWLDSATLKELSQVTGYPMRFFLRQTPLPVLDKPHWECLRREYWTGAR